MHLRNVMTIATLGLFILLGAHQSSYSQSNGTLPTPTTTSTFVMTQVPMPTSTETVATPTPTIEEPTITPATTSVEQTATNTNTPQPSTVTPTSTPIKTATPIIYYSMLPVILMPFPTPTFTPTPTNSPTPINTPTPTITPTSTNTPIPTPQPYNVSAKDFTLRPANVPSGWSVLNDEWEQISVEESQQLKIWSAYFSQYGNDSPTSYSHFLAGSESIIYMTPADASAGIGRWITGMQQEPRITQVTVPSIGEETVGFRHYRLIDGTDYVRFNIVFRLNNIRIEVWTWDYRQSESINPAISYARLLAGKRPSANLLASSQPTCTAMLCDTDDNEIELESSQSYLSGVYRNFNSIK